MRRRGKPDVLRDPEVLELLRDEPQLLAIADAIHAALGEQYRRTRGRRRLVRIAMVPAAAVAVAVLALVQPWGGGGRGLVAQALAAIPGRGPGVHAVLESPLPGVELVELRSGRVSPEQVRLEFWFDPQRNLLHTLVRREGAVVADELASPERAFSSTGPLLGPGSPSLDPALLAFASGYRQALTSGAARPAGRALAGRRSVPLLEVATPLGREQVTLDPKTLRPREIRPLLPTGRAGGPATRVLTLASVSVRPADFIVRSQRVASAPSGGAIEESAPVTLAQARQALRRPPLWAGRSLTRLPLRLLAKQRLTLFFAGARGSHGAERGLDLIYGAVLDSRPNWNSQFLEIQEATAPEPAYGFLPGPLRIEPLPPPGLLRIERQQLAGRPGRAIWRGELQRDGLYLAVTGSSRKLVLTAARALHPLSAT